MELEPDDFKRLSFEVRQFLGKADLLTRLSGMAKLYLEFPDVGTMHNVHRAIIDAMDPAMLVMSGTGRPWEFVDDHTIEIEPYAGVSIILSCKQRFAVRSGGSVGYRDIAFKQVKLRDTE